MAGEHILIVDDEHAIQSSLRGVLRRGLPGDDGRHGKGRPAHARRRDPDLIFLDIWMPGLDGLDTLSEIKRLRPEPAVIMISGHATIETAVKATRLGAYDFIEKPLSLEKRPARPPPTPSSTRAWPARTRPCARASTGGSNHG